MMSWILILARLGVWDVFMSDQKDCQVVTGKLGLHEPKMALVVLDDSFYHFAQPKVLIIKQSESFLIRNKCHYLMICLRGMTMAS